MSIKQDKLLALIERRLMAAEALLIRFDAATLAPTEVIAAAEANRLLADAAANIARDFNINGFE